MDKQAAGAQTIERMMQTYGCLPAAPDGPTIAIFNPHDLAVALESEMNRASNYGFTKITLHMDMLDAALLAKHLRKG